MSKLVSWFKLIYWKIMSSVDNLTEKWETSQGELSELINEDEIFTIVFSGGEIIVIYNNHANDKFPATTENVNTAYRILARLTNKLKFKK